MSTTDSPRMKKMKMPVPVAVAILVGVAAFVAADAWNEFLYVGIAAAVGYGLGWLIMLGLQWLRERNAEGKAERLEDRFTKEQLEDQARGLGIERSSSMTKEELAEAIAHRRAA